MANRIITDGAGQELSARLDNVIAELNGEDTVDVSSADYTSKDIFDEETGRGLATKLGTVAEAIKTHDAAVAQDLASEASARASADASLQSHIDTEASRAMTAEAAAQSAASAAQSTADSAVTAAAAAQTAANNAQNTADENADAIADIVSGTTTVAKATNASNAEKVTNALTVGTTTYNGSAAVNAGRRSWYGTCSTAASTTAKVVTCSDFVLETGTKVTVYFTYANSASAPTLNVNSTGAIAIRNSNGAAGTLTYRWYAYQAVDFIYNGTYWLLQQPVVATTTYYGMSRVASATLNGSLTATPSWYAPTTVGSSGQIPKSNGSGAPSWSDYTPACLDDMDWDEIEDICSAGKAPSVFHVGQEKKISLSTGEEVTAVILGFNHDDLSTTDSSYNGGTGKAAITWGLKNALKTTYAMNTSNTNSGGWTSSNMRSTYMSTFKGYLPSALQSALKTVTKKTSAGSASSTIESTSDELFLFSQIEVFGTYYYNQDDSPTQYSYSGEGKQYDYYKGNTWISSYAKYTADKFGTARTYTANVYYQQNSYKGLGDTATSSSSWWLRSPNYGSSTNFCGVGIIGVCYYYYASSTDGVVFGFCT